MIVLVRVPLVGAKKIDIETINHLESLTDNAISILENVNVTEIPKRISKIPPEIPLTIKKTEIRKVMEGMRNRLYDTEKLIRDCDSRSIKVMSEAIGYMEKNREKYGDLLTSESDYRQLVKYSKELERFFTALCKCKPTFKEKIKIKNA